MTHTNKKAFSLIEISIVIVVLAILISFIPDVLQLKDNAKISKVRALTQSAPLQHMDDLIIWYESSMPDSFIESEAIENGNISTWYNRAPQSKRINNATQTNADNQPKYVTNVLNDVIPAVLFDGNDLMYFDGSKMINTDYTIFVVEMRNSGSALTFVGGSTNDVNSNIIAAYRNSTTITLAHYGNDINCSVAAYSKLIPAIHTFQMSSMPNFGKRYWLNGGGDNPDCSSSTQTVYAYRFYGASIGRYYNWLYRGYIMEIIVFRRAISNQERQEIEKYLSKKYAIILN